ncbi:MAG: HD-GYP domain-containing protein [Caldilineaceae bacterium]
MSQVARLYIATILGGAVILSYWAFITLPTAKPSFSLFLSLTLLTTFLVVFTIDGPNYKSFEGSTIGAVAAIFLLPAGYYIVLTVFAFVVKWAKARWIDRERALGWYVHPFNTATTIIGGMGAYVILEWSQFQLTDTLSLAQLPYVLLICLVHVMLQQVMLGGWLMFVRGVAFHEADIWGEGVRLELPQALMGYLAAELYLCEPLLTLFILAPVALIYQALMLPKVQAEAMRTLKHFTQEVTEKNQAIQQLNNDLFITLAKIFDARDPYVGGHAAQVAAYAVAIAEALQLPPERIEILRQSAYLHDIGKVAIPEAILHKPERLSESEYQLVQKHAEIGAELIASSQGLHHLAPFIRHHHERWDGQGYPAGLAGDKIPLESRILNICDSVEAMASDRPYHRAMSVSQIIHEVKRCAGRQFDPDVAKAFIQITEQAGAQFVVNSAHTVTERQSDNKLVLDSAITFQLAQIYGMAPLQTAPGS